MQWILHRQQLPNLPPAVCRIEALNSFKFLKIHQVKGLLYRFRNSFYLSAHKIGENTAHVRFDTKKNGSQITQQNYLGGGANCQGCKKYQFFVLDIDILRY